MANAIKRPVKLIDETIMNKIYLVKGKKVMIDRDLAELYGVETKVLKQAVRRNKERFPPDFMFAMNQKQLKNWRSQFVTSNFGDKMGLRYAPFCFTEQGVTMLSCILNSKRAIAMNIQIIRIFARLREMIMTNKGILLKLRELESRVTGHDENIQRIFGALKQLLNPPPLPRRKIGFRKDIDED